MATTILAKNICFVRRKEYLMMKQSYFITQILYVASR